MEMEIISMSGVTDGSEFSQAGCRVRQIGLGPWPASNHIENSFINHPSVGDVQFIMELSGNYM